NRASSITSNVSARRPPADKQSDQVVVTQSCAGLPRRNRLDSFFGCNGERVAVPGCTRRHDGKRSPLFCVRTFEGTAPMPKTSYYVPNIHIDGDLYKGSWFAARWFSSKSEDAAAARYEGRVLDIIDKSLWGTWTGTRLLQEIKKRSPKRIDI